MRCPNCKTTLKRVIEPQHMQWPIGKHQLLVNYEVTNFKCDQCGYIYTEDDTDARFMQALDKNRDEFWRTLLDGVAQPHEIERMKQISMAAMERLAAGELTDRANGLEEYARWLRTPNENNRPGEAGATV